MMNGYGAQALMAGGILTVVAAVAHLACIGLGARAYRFMGAGERLVRAVEAGRAGPTFITLAIAAVLVACAMYAFSGAGVIELPFTGVVLPLVSAAFLGRAVGFPLLKPVFPKNSDAFWMWSSALCLVLGMLYALGSIHAWTGAR